MPIVHIVQFAFKQTASDVELVEMMLDLKNSCVHPTTKDPYIISAVGGKNNSPEGANKGLTHGFVLTFASFADRDYYLDHDPAHQDFKKKVAPVLADACVVDFETGVY